MNFERKNINRGYRKLRIWQEAIEYYKQTCKVFLEFPSELKRVASNQIASVDSIHRNIAEGYCRRSIREYLNFLTISKGSLGESISGLHAYNNANQLSNNDFKILDSLAFKLENGLLRLIETLEQKDIKNWSDTLVIKETNKAYNQDENEN